MEKSEPPMTRKKIAIIDDEQDILSVCEQHLRGNGYEVAIFSDPAEALRAIRANRPDLVISDLKMPGLNGLEVCDFLRSFQATSDTPIILMTAFKDKRPFVESLNIKSLFFIEKPFEPTEFLKTVHVALATSYDADDYAVGQ